MNAAKAMRIGGWVLSGLIAALMCMSATFKLNPPPEIAAEFAKSNLTPQIMFNIGIVELLCTLLFLLPWTGFWGAILLTGYLGGATFVHVQQREAPVMPIVIGVLVWVALGLRRSEIFALAMGKRLDARSGSGT